MKRRNVARAVPCLPCWRCKHGVAVYWANDGNGRALHRCVGCGATQTGPFPGELRGA